MVDSNSHEEHKDPSITELVAKLQKIFPGIRYKQSTSFMWSPTSRTIYYKNSIPTSLPSAQQLLHETGHALLDHKTYTYDIELIQIEVAAWKRAKLLGEELRIPIDEEHIQNCLDTYRNWLYKRSACPNCLQTGVQQNQLFYECINCRQEWSVSQERLCRPYRRSLAV